MLLWIAAGLPLLLTYCEKELHCAYQTFFYWISFQAKSIAEPFAFEEYRKKRIQDKIEEERANRVRLKVRPNMFYTVKLSWV